MSLGGRCVYRVSRMVGTPCLYGGDDRLYPFAGCTEWRSVYLLSVLRSLIYNV